jgi:ABC-type lipoprotein export system ATPase subunit
VTLNRLIRIFSLAPDRWAMFLLSMINSVFDGFLIFILSRYFKIYLSVNNVDTWMNDSAFNGYINTQNVIGLIILRFILSYWSNGIIFRSTAKLEAIIRWKIIDAFVLKERVPKTYEVDAVITDTLVWPQLLSSSIYAFGVKAFGDFIFVFGTTLAISYVANSWELILLGPIFFIIGLIFLKFSRSRSRDGILSAQNEATEKITEIINNREWFLVNPEMFSNVRGFDRKLEEERGKLLLAGRMPRIYVESLGYAALVLIIYLLAGSSSLQNEILFILVASSIKLLPTAGSYISFISTIKHLSEVMDNVFGRIDEKKIKHANQTELEKLTLEIRGKDVEDKIILRNFNLEISKGDKIYLTGESGSGKTSILRILSGIDKDFDGVVKINGVEPVGVLHSIVEYQTQFPSVMASDFLITEETRNSENAANLLKILNLANLTNESRGILSGGEMQRIAFLRTMLTYKPMILLDEPTSALDSMNTKNVADILNISKSTIVLVTHDLDLVGELDASWKEVSIS